MEYLAANQSNDANGDLAARQIEEISDVYRTAAASPSPQREMHGSDNGARVPTPSTVTFARSSAQSEVAVRELLATAVKL